MNKIHQQSHNLKAVELSELSAAFKPLQFGDFYWENETHLCADALEEAMGLLL